MVAVCAAAVGGQQDQWEVAQALAGSSSASLGNDCLAGVVRALFDRALAWHAANPGQEPAVRFQRVSDRTECGAREETGETSTEPSTETEQPTSETTQPTSSTEVSETTEVTETTETTETTEIPE